jgi:hypothetical protein
VFCLLGLGGCGFYEVGGLVGGTVVMVVIVEELPLDRIGFLWMLVFSV